MRVFLGVPVPAPVRTYVCCLARTMRQQGLRAGWTRPENLHLTVLFLGDQQQDALATYLERVTAALAPVSAFNLLCAGLGTFGTPARVLYLGWAGPDSGEFTALCRCAREQARECGLNLPPGVLGQRPVPHLTVARFRRRADARGLQAFGNRVQGNWQWNERVPGPPAEVAGIRIDKVLCFQSRLGPDGPRYRTLAELSLRDA